jgi:hypothetical protein
MIDIHKENLISLRTAANLRPCGRTAGQRTFRRYFVGFSEVFGAFGSRPCASVGHCSPRARRYSALRTN